MKTATFCLLWRETQAKADYAQVKIKADLEEEYTPGVPVKNGLSSDKETNSTKTKGGNLTEKALSNRGTNATRITSDESTATDKLF